MELFQSMDKQTHFTMLLAPFQPTIKIELEAYLSTTVECYLDIKNTSNKMLNVTITKVPDPKRQITLNTGKLEIPGQSSSTISIKWSPIEAGCWRDVLQLTDNRRIKYDIAIVTTAKVNKVKIQKKSSKKIISSKLSVVSLSTINKQDVLSIPSNISRSLHININKQTRGNEAKREISLNKENILSKCEVKIYTSQEDDRSVRHHMHHEPMNILSEQHSSVWNDGNVLPQVFLASNMPQEIRRATYVKEKKHCNGTTTIYECNEVTEDIACTGGQSEENFSMLINEMKFTTTDVMASPEPLKKGSMEFMNLPNVDGARYEKNKTYAVDHRTFEVSAISVPEIGSIVLSPLTRPLEYHESSFKDGANNLIASSPILQQSYNNVPSTAERSGCFVDSIDCSHRIDCEFFNCETVSDDIETVKKAEDVYIEISPPRKYQSKPYSPLFNTKTGRITKERNLYNGKSAKGFQLFVPVTTKKSTKKNVPAIKINKSTLCTLRQIKKCTPSTTRGTKPQVEGISIYEVFMPSPFTSCMTKNPFLKTTASNFNEKWLLRQELVFILWLNTVLSAPKDLRVNIDNMIIDTNDKCQLRKDHDEGMGVNALATTQETVSTSHHTAKNLHLLRKSAYDMFRSIDITKMKSCIDRCVVEGMLYIRTDRDLHRDISLQKDALNVFLCYNPLWLRIGLEAIYNESIPLRNNNDVFGLTRFLTERFFTDPQLTKVPGYHRADPNKKFLKALNQLMLKRFLLLVYFLDYAKKRKLIAHDPCLFRKQAAWKTSREILLRFSRDLLAGIGDVTKILRTYNYVLTHQQMYIDEYEYDVADIRQDLRDGVRLCRVVELITGIDGLTRQCRAPAISRLQKVHNVEVALSTLRDTGGVFVDDVEAKNIADGNRTKTLSLLWQIIHKIQAPRFNEAAYVIQRWWRSRVWYVRIKNYLHARRDHAAIVIQRAWRHWWKTEIAEERINFLRAKEAAIHLQRWWRRMQKSAYMSKRRELEDKRRRAVLALQRRWRATLLMKIHRKQYRDLRNAALMIQTYWRMKRAMKLQRAELLRIFENAAVRIQNWWRSSRLTREKREWFLRCRRSALLIQRTWRTYHARKQKIRDACLRIQTWWRAASCSHRYQMQKSSCVKLQRWWRERQRYMTQRRAVLLIESWYLCVKTERIARENYLRIRDAAKRIQIWWRAVLFAREERKRYQQLRYSVVILQTHWRRRVLALRDRQQFLTKRMACVTLQSYWRMNRVRKYYERCRRCVITLQRRWRAVLLAREERRRYQQLRQSVVILQTQWRRHVLARRDRQQFLAKRMACITLQSYWRMIRIRRYYERCRNCTIMLQRRWRAIRAGRLVKRKYEDTRERVILIQTRWRVFMARRRFLRCRQAAIIIQSYYRMKAAVKWFNDTKNAVLTIQMYWRQYRQKKIEAELLRQHGDLALIVMDIQNECGDNRSGQKAVGRSILPNSNYWQQTIDILRTCNNVGALLTCLNSLDTIMKLSPTICVTLCQLNLVDEIYKTLSQRNRSQPWMIVCQRACSILITLAKYPYTKKYIVKQEHALLLVKLLSDTLKNKEVFLHCATLIWHLSKDEDYLKAMMTRLDIRWLLKNIQQKISKATTIAKLQKSKKFNKLYASCESDQGNTLQFANMDAAILAIINRTNTWY